jgi:hypothetical protein
MQIQTRFCTSKLQITNYKACKANPNRFQTPISNDLDDLNKIATEYPALWAGVKGTLQKVEEYFQYTEMVKQVQHDI